MAKKKRKNRPTKLAIDVVEARSFVLVDEYGNERASLSCTGGSGDGEGVTVVHINDSQRRPCLSIQVDEQGNSNICLFTMNSAPGVSIVVDSSRGNGLGITDGEGKPCIMLGVPGPESQDPRAPTPDISIIDEQGRRFWSAFGGTAETGEPADEGDGE